jgi:hypothetical protein
VAARVTCCGCGSFLSTGLEELGLDALQRQTQDREATVPAGSVVRDPEPIAFSVTSAGAATRSRENAPAHALVVHPDDVRKLRSAGADHGCCGSDGLEGPNRACASCGRLVAIARTDCWTPAEVRFLPTTVRLIDG